MGVVARQCRRVSFPGISAWGSLCRVAFVSTKEELFAGKKKPSQQSWTGFDSLTL
jgi:hypothetical protein